MLKKLLILFIAIAPIAAIAQEVKIAYINTQEIFSTMPEIPGIEKQLSDKQEEIKKNAQALETELNNKSQELEKMPATTSETVKQDKQREIQQIYERYQVFMQNSQQEIQQLQQKLVEPIQKKIADAIKSVGDEKGFTYMFDLSAGNIVYHSPSAVDAAPFVKTKLGIK